MFNLKSERRSLIMNSLVKSNGTLFPTVSSLLDDFFTRDWLDSTLARGTASGSTLPAVNVMETDESFSIEVAAPGMKREDFKVELDNNLLTISSERKDSNEEKDPEGNYTRREFSYQSFRRSFTLPQEKVLGEQITAKYADGILYITIPKSERAKAKPAKQIEIF
jgi:HSP20 family protein